MKRFLLLAVVVGLTAATSQAGPLQRVFGGRLRPAAVAPCGPQSPVPYEVTAGVTDGGVQWKADVQARQGRCFHPGGGFTSGASFEGVGYSSASPQDALAHCCTNGGPVVAQAVSHGPGGWYAVKQYGTPGLARQAVGAVVSHTGQAIGEIGGLIQHGTVYHPPAAPIPTGNLGYTPIRLGAPLPTTCVNCPK